MNPVRLLLVEDDAVSRGFLVHALETMTATVTDIATSGSEALGIARATRHALWLLDANLRDMRGEHLLRDLRDLQSGVPALCLTAEVDPARIASLEGAGFVEVLQKPLGILALHAAVRRALGAIAPADGAPRIWDDARALQALGGNVAALRALRGLFVGELPQQEQAILAAIAAGDLAAARGELHRLTASCGFVGSARLHAAVRRLHDTPSDDACIAQFRAQVRAALEPPQPGA